ncbi:predicted protein [Listeria monocytogenes FSL N1-017]|nr:predicted protein [Listeria monocytogenes FSL N1-017]
MIHITWKKERILPLKKVRIPKLQLPHNASLHPISSISLYILAHKIRLSNHISFENAIIKKRKEMKLQRRIVVLRGKCVTT